MNSTSEETFEAPDAELERLYDKADLIRASGQPARGRLGGRSFELFWTADKKQRGWWEARDESGRIERLIGRGVQLQRTRTFVRYLKRAVLEHPQPIGIAFLPTAELRGQKPCSLCGVPQGRKGAWVWIYVRWGRQWHCSICTNCYGARAVEFERLNTQYMQDLDRDEDLPDLRGGRVVAFSR